MKDSVRRARLLRSGLERDGWRVRIVNKLGGIEDLMTIVERRIIEVPMWLHVVGGTERLRLRGVPTVKEARKYL